MFWHFLGWKNKFFQNCSKLPKNHFRTIKILFFSRFSAITRVGGCVRLNLENSRFFLNPFLLGKQPKWGVKFWSVILKKRFFFWGGANLSCFDSQIFDTKKWLNLWNKGRVVLISFLAASLIKKGLCLYFNYVKPWFNLSLTKWQDFLI